MTNFRRALLKLRDLDADFRDLSDCCGDEGRTPPSEELLEWGRRFLERELDLPVGVASLKHDASPWRHGLLACSMVMAEDQDVEAWRWLAQGAPMGLACDVHPGGHFPPARESSFMPLTALDALKSESKNHDSFHGIFDENERPPAWDLLESQVHSGFALLFRDRAHAEEVLGGRTHPAPLGCVSKQKDDGSWKHRLIQYLRANQVNAAVRLPERQVLPRGIDHGVDLAIMAASKKEDEEVSTLILDYKDAFMSIPLAEDERRFNCASTEFALPRGRDALYPNEPDVGGFVVWRVLGFGGKPNPLIFSRVASLASRTAQALLGPVHDADRVPEHDCLAKGRLQLYVDDPVLTCVGTRDQISTSMDLVLSWWLILGIPLSWSKGAVFHEREKHRWIGIDYVLSDDGAVMTLPEKFLKDLAELIEPLCQAKGTVALSDLDAIIGKAARVAHVVPYARPFVAGLWGALAAVQRLGQNGVREAPPGRAACRRFCYAAAWVRALITASE
jgi:hypothetical protein